MKLTIKLTIMVALLAILAGCMSMYPSYISGEVDTSKLSVGMSEREVVEEVGKPAKINRSDGAYGSRAQFVYGMDYKRTYLYFEDYRLVSWQH